MSKLSPKRVFQFIKKWIDFFVKPLKDRLKLSALRSRTIYAKHYKHTGINPKMVMYEAFFGRGMLDNPYAIFRELLKDPVYKKYVHVWAIDGDDDIKELEREYAGYGKVRFVKYNSKKYLKYLCKAKYLINNVTFPSYFTKRDKQIYVNTWHGIPLKSLGFDMPDGAIETSNTIRNFLHTDYMVSASPFLTEVYTGSAYKLGGLYNGRIIEEGYPRLDLLKNTDKKYIVDKLRKSGINIDPEKKLVLYAPTWRGASYGMADSNINGYFRIKEFFDETPELAGYQLIIKVHQRVFQIARELVDPSFMIPATIDANEVLSITDILISDFSSIFFDFLATKRPVVFYIPDLEQYENERGMYFNVNELPGPCAVTLEELKDTFCDLGAATAGYAARYDELFRENCDYDIGAVSKRIIDIVFRNKKDNYRLIDVSCPEKKKILLSRGEMLVNGISTSFMNLLSKIDYTKYDVSIMITNPKDDLQKNLINQIDPRARVLLRNSTNNLTAYEDACQRIVSYYGIQGKGKPFYKKKAFQREFIRCYGRQNYDYVLDFEGYNIFFGLLCAQHPTAKCGIWMHNDMLAEKNVRFQWLEKIFTMYPLFDYLISCSNAIMKVNQANLSTPQIAGKFRYAKNIIEYNRVLRGKESSELVTVDGTEYCLILAEEPVKAEEYNLIPYEVPKIGLLRHTVDDAKSEEIISLRAPAEASAAKKAAICNEQVVHFAPVNKITFRIPLNAAAEDAERSDRVIHFASVGRLSIEKNYQNLIKAFSGIVKDYPLAMLYIIGDGPDRAKLTALIEELMLQGNVILTGNIKNPFGLLKFCDCFILPSLHEGQPMVIHEARVIGMPIIVSDFSSVEGIIIPDGQLVINTSEGDIYNAMMEFINGNVPCDYEFDAETYNNEAYEEFLHAIGEK